MKISPDGKFLAFSRHTTGHEVITVLHYPELKLSGQAHFGDRIGRRGEFFGLDDRDAPTCGVFTLRPATGEKKLLCTSGCVVPSAGTTSALRA